MHRKRAFVLWVYLSLLALAACWPKVIDDADLVSVDYKYSFIDWTLIEQWSKDFIMWDDSENLWLESLVRWAKQSDEFSGIVNWKELYKSDYNYSSVQSYPKVILTEVMWIMNPVVGMEVDVSDIWTWIIVDIKKDSDWYDVYVVDFNEPRTYSDLSYYVKITGIEKK